MEREGLGDFELLVFVIAGSGLALVVAVWSGAWLSLVVSGETRGLPFSAAAEALPRLPSNLRSPAAAWSTPYAPALPGASLYWGCTALSTPTIVAAVAGVIRWLARPTLGPAWRRPLRGRSRTLALYRGLRCTGDAPHSAMRPLSLLSPA